MPQRNLKSVKQPNIMKRRTALKNLTLSLGYTVATPTIFSMLASCNAETETWTPRFLSPEEKHMVIHLTDIILPTTETLGALDVNVPQFLDLMYHDIETATNQELFKKGASAFADAFSKAFEKEAINGDKASYEKLLSDYFNVSDEDSKNILEQQNLPIEEVNNTDIDNYALYKFLFSVKSYTLFGYFTSEKVGEEILNYDPIPGSYIGCMPIENSPNERAWSL